MEYLKRLKGGESEKTVRVRFEDETIRTHLTLASAAGTRVLIGDGVGGTVEERVPVACFTRRGTSVRIAAVLEPVRAEGKPSITDVLLSEEKGRFTILIKKGDKQDRIIVGPKRKVMVECDGKTVLTAP